MTPLGGQVADIELNDLRLAFFIEAGLDLGFNQTAGFGPYRSRHLDGFRVVQTFGDVLVDEGSCKQRTLPKTQSQKACLGILKQASDKRVDIQNLSAPGIRDYDAVGRGFEQAAVARFGGLLTFREVE